MGGTATDAHAAVLEGARLGVPVRFGERRNGELPGYDDEESWAGRSVEGEWLSELLTSGRDDLHRRGLAIHGARILGELDLEGSEVGHGLRLVGCQLGNHRLVLRDARLRAVDLTESACGGVDGEGAQIQGALLLGRGFVCLGEVRLGGAVIAGDLDCSGAALRNPGGDALSASGAEVSGSVVLSDGFVALGHVDLGRIMISRDLRCPEGRFVNEATEALTLYGARIGGAASLRDMSVEGEILLVNCTIGGDLSLRRSRLRNPGGYCLRGSRASVGGGVFMDDTKTDGRFRLAGGTVRGSIRCESAVMSDPEVALDLEGVTFGGSVVLNNGFAANGAVRLAGAVVAGNVDCNDGRFFRPGSQAIAASHCRVAGAVLLGSGMTADGCIDLTGAVIDGDLRFDDARMTGADHNGNAVVADRARVGGSAFMCGTFEAAGALRLTGASIDGNFELVGARLTRPDRTGNSLVAEGLRVRGSTMFAHLEAAGTIRLLDAAIEGSMDMAGAKLVGADADGNSLLGQGLHVAGTVFMTDGFDPTGAVHLTGAVVGRQLRFTGAQPFPKLGLRAVHCLELVDDGSSWPSPGNLVLDGFRFDRLHSEPTWRHRLDWVRRQGYVNWSPDPYEQLATYYARTGDEQASRRIQIAKHDDELVHLKTTRKHGTRAYRFWRRPLGWLVGYGYRRHRAGWLLLTILLAAGISFRLAEIDGAMIPTERRDTSAAHPEPCGRAHTCFNSWIYGADVVLPIIDLGQDTAWRPIATPARGPLWIWTRWAFIAVGWALASVFVAAFTGLVQRP